MTHASELTSCSWRPDDRAVAFYASSNSIRSSPRVGARAAFLCKQKAPCRALSLFHCGHTSQTKAPRSFQIVCNAISMRFSVSQDCVHHQPVRASRHDFLDRRIARHSCGLREQQSLC